MSLSRRDQALLALLLVFIIGFAFFRLAYLPTSEEIQTLTSSNEQLQLEKQNLQKEVKKTPVKDKEMEEKFANLNKRLPTEDELVPLLRLLDETTKQNQLPLSSIDYKGAEKPDETGAQTLVFTISTKGKVDKLFKLLAELENAERLISVEDVAFTAVKAETSNKSEEVEAGPPAYYIAPPGIPEAKLQRIKFEIITEEKETVTQSDRPVAESYMPDTFDMKITINAYYAAKQETAQQPADTENKPANDAKGEV